MYSGGCGREGEVIGDSWHKALIHFLAYSQNSNQNIQHRNQIGQNKFVRSFVCLFSYLSEQIMTFLSDYKISQV